MVRKPYSLILIRIRILGLKIGQKVIFESQLPQNRLVHQSVTIETSTNHKFLIGSRLRSYQYIAGGVISSNPRMRQRDSKISRLFTAQLTEIHQNLNSRQVAIRFVTTSDPLRASFKVVATGFIITDDAPWWQVAISHCPPY